MENLILIATVLAIHIFAWFTPGPLFILILRNSLAYSRKAGIWTAAGIAVGNLIHVTYAVIGLVFVISLSDALFDVIRFVGAGYLAYLGVRTLIATGGEREATIETDQTELSPFGAFKMGFLVNILSPKASLFFASVFAVVLAAGAPPWTIVFLMLAMPLNSFVMASILSTFFTLENIRMFYSKYERVINRFLGTTLILFALLAILYVR